MAGKDAEDKRYRKEQFWELILRTVIVISAMNTVVFYTLSNKPGLLTLQFSVAITALTILVMCISVWFVLKSSVHERMHKYLFWGKRYR
ncbi:MAG TPA: hypothetical protein VND15_01625 [Candidatus Acidoferrales bacterium]|nr:hypothetical protein [Candidatus Acidoferrales bacterium]